jgi:hypothetical protein
MTGSFARSKIESVVIDHSGAGKADAGRESRTMTT